MALNDMCFNEGKTRYLVMYNNIYQINSINQFQFVSKFADAIVGRSVIRTVVLALP